MKLVFLIPLTIGLVTGYISQNSDEDIKYITAVISAITLILSLFFAPWQIQLLILILVLSNKSLFWRRTEYSANSTPTGSQKFTPKSNSDRSQKTVQPVATNTVEKSEIPGKYRGVTYEPIHASTGFTEGAVGGKYRGIPWRIHLMQNSTQQLAHLDSNYRGTNLKPEITQNAQNQDLVNIKIRKPKLFGDSPG
jgi:hypothetical protein